MLINESPDRPHLKVSSVTGMVAEQQLAGRLRRLVPEPSVQRLSNPCFYD